MEQLKEQKLGERLLIPCNMLRIADEDVFLDDMTDGRSFRKLVKES